MRIITGRAGGLKLKPVPGRNTRPTTDRVKESVFAILGARCVDALVLDLFAGTGALGLEALSRGARRAVFVEKQGGALKVLHENLRSTGLAADSRVVAADALSALGRFGGAVGAEAPAAPEEGPFNLVFLDPPYNTGLAEAALERLGGGRALAPDALVVVEHSNHALPAEQIDALRLHRRERYGETVVSFYVREGEGELGR